MRIMATTFLVALCSIIYELVLAQLNNIIWGQTVLSYSLTIGIYLMSLGLGSFFYKRIKMKPESLFVFVEVLLFTIGVSSPILVALVTPSIVHKMPLLLYTISYSPIVAIGLLSGLEIPLLTDLNLGSGFEKILGVDYFGSLVGTVLYALYLYPKLGIISTAIVIASINLFVAIYFAFKNINNKSILSFLVVLLVFDISLLSNTSHIQDYIMKQFRGEMIEKKLNQKVEIINYKRTPYQTISHIQYYNNYYKKKHNIVFLNDNVQLNDKWMDEYHKSLIMPFAYYFSTDKNLKVAVLGGGDGQLVKLLLEFDNVSTIDLFDLDKDVIDFFSNDPYYSQFNGLNLKSPKVNLKIGDVYYKLRDKVINGDTKQYDAIFFDLPGLKSEELLKLYSLEFFSYINLTLKDSGIFVAWMYPREEIQDIVQANLFLANFNYLKKSCLYSKGYPPPSFQGDLIHENCYSDIFYIVSKRELVGESTNLKDSYILEASSFMSDNPWRPLRKKNSYKLRNSLFLPNYELLSLSKKGSVKKKK